MRYTDSPTSGFTLIELLLYVSIVGTIVSGASAFFTLSIEARVKSQTVAEVEQQGIAAIEYIAQTVRNATAITSPATGGTGSSLTLTVPTGSLSPTLFDVSGGAELQVKEGVGAAIPLTSNKVQVSGLTFKNLTRSGTGGAVQISFTVSRVNTTGRNEYSYQKTFTTTAVIK